MKKLLVLLGIVLLTLLISSVAFADLQGDTALYYSFDNDNLSASNPLDLTPAGNDGTNNGATTNITGLINQSFNYDGLSNYVTTNTDTNTILGTTQGFSISFWAKSDNTPTGDEAIISDRASDGSSATFLFNYASSSSKWRFVAYDSTLTARALVFNQTFISTTQYDHVVIIYNSTDTLWSVYHNNVLAGTLDYDRSTNGDIMIIGESSGLSYFFDGSFDELGLFNKTLTPEEITLLYSSRNGNQYPFSSDAVSNFTITAKDIWDDSAIDTFNATLDGTTYTTTNGTITTDILQNATSTYTVLVEADDYFDRTYTDYNVSANLQAELTQARIAFQAYPINWDDTNYIFSESGVAGNFTIDTITLKNDTKFNISAGTYNVTFSSNSDLNWYNVTEEVTIDALSDSTYKFDQIYNSKTNASFVTRHDGQPLTESIQLIAYNSEGDTCFGSCPNSYWDFLGYEPYYQLNTTVTNGNILLNISNVTPRLNDVNDLILDNYTFIVTSETYFPKNFTFNTSAGEVDKEFILEEKGALNITVLDSETNESVGEDVTLVAESNLEQLTFTLSNGQGIIEGFRFNTEYDLFFNSSTYEEAYYNLFYNEQTFDFYYYMRQDGTNLTVTVTDVLANPLDNAQVVVERFVNGTYQTVGSRLTDVQGLSFFNLVQGDTHRATVSKDGYISQTFNTQFLEGDIDVVLERSTQVDYDGPTNNIIWAYDPQPGVITGVQLFQWNVTSSDSELETFSMYIYNGSTLIASNSSTTAAGGSLSISINTTEYFNSSLTAVYSFKKTDFDAVYYRASYLIFNLFSVDASAEDFRTWVETNTTLTQRIVLLTFLVVSFAILVSVILPASINVITTGVVTLFLGYIFVIDLFVLGIIVTPIILGGVVLASKTL